MSEQLHWAIVEVMLEIEAQILGDMVDYLKMKDDMDSSEIVAWQINALAMLGQLDRKHIQTISQKSGVAMENLLELLKEHGYKVAADVDKVLMAGGVVATAPNVLQSTALMEILLSYQQQAVDKFNLTGTTILKESQQVYMNIVNVTVGKVLAGVTTPQKALAETVREWANNGIPVLIDKAGKRWGAEGYFNMLVRTMTNNIANDMQDKRMDEFEVDLVEISSHFDARPKCAPYQGRIFSRVPGNPDYPYLGNTSYGEPDGLFGINCRHIKYPYIEGYSRKTYSPYSEASVDKAYKESQQQRAIERSIRKAKTELELMRKLGDTEAIKVAHKKVSHQQQRIRDFIESSGRTRRRNREQIVKQA